MYTYNFKMVIGASSLSPEAEQAFARLSLVQVQNPPFS